MRIWIVDPPNMVPYYDASLCRALQAEGHDITMITSPFTYDDWPIYQGVQVNFIFSHFLLQALPRKLCQNKRLRRVFRAATYPLDLLKLITQLPQPPAIIHFQWSAVPFLDAWAWRYIIKKGHRLVYTAHNVIPHDTVKPPPNLAALYNIPQRIIVHSYALAQQMEETFPETSARLSVIPMGVLFEDVTDLSRAEARRKLNLPSETPVALFWGLIEPYKGVECLIKAFSLVARELPQARLLIVGRANISIEPYQNLIQALNLSEAIYTRFEFVPTEEISLYFSAADLVVLPYLEASQSAVLLTAYRFGRAVLVTETGGLPETVMPERNGLVVPPNDETALAEALIRLLSAPQTLVDMGAASQKLGTEKHNWRKIAKQTTNLYRQLFPYGM